MILYHCMRLFHIGAIKLLHFQYLILLNFYCINLILHIIYINIIIFCYRYFWVPWIFYFVFFSWFCFQNCEIRNRRKHIKVKYDKKWKMCAENVLCVECGVSGEFKKCARCRTDSYCGKNCQKKHWSKHKIKCQVIHKENELGKELEVINNGKI